MYHGQPHLQPPPPPGAVHAHHQYRLDPYGPPPTQPRYEPRPLLHESQSYGPGPPVPQLGVSTALPPVSVTGMGPVSSKRSAPQTPHPSEPSAKRQSKWSPSEDALITELRGGGMKWEDISKRLPGRSAMSCRLRYQNYIERRSEWDEEKKNKLARLYERFKERMWEQVAKEMAIPWRAAEAMHWQLGEQEMAQRANVPLFQLSSVATSSTGTPGPNSTSRPGPPAPPSAGSQTPTLSTQTPHVPMLNPGPGTPVGEVRRSPYTPGGPLPPLAEPNYPSAPLPGHALSQAQRHEHPPPLQRSQTETISPPSARSRRSNTAVPTISSSNRTEAVSAAGVNRKRASSARGGERYSGAGEKMGSPLGFGAKGGRGSSAGSEGGVRLVEVVEVQLGREEAGGEAEVEGARSIAEEALAGLKGNGKSENGDSAGAVQPPSGEEGRRTSIERPRSAESLRSIKEEERRDVEMSGVKEERV